MKFVGAILVLVACIYSYPTVDGELLGLTAGCSASNIGAYSLINLPIPVLKPKPDPKPDDRKPLFPNRPHIIIKDDQPAVVTPPQAVNNGCTNGTCKPIRRFRLFN